LRTLLISIGTAFVLMVVTARGLSGFAPGHFLPLQQMDRALSAGDGCALFLGDSRMVAAFDAAAFHAAARDAGRDLCHAQLAIGGTDIEGAFVALREYLSQGRLPAVVVIGKVGDSLLGPVSPLSPEEMVGNNAILLTWTTAADVFTEVPGFPFHDLGAFDRGFRFLASRLTPIGRYQSLVAIRVQHLEGALIGGPGEFVNQFGSLGDMMMLEKGLRIRAPERLAEAVRAPEVERIGPWFPRILALLERRGIRTLIVELPMRRTYREHVTNTPSAQTYQRRLSEDLSRHGSALLDLSRSPWLDDGLFVDQLHIGQAGAARVSAAIGRRIAQLSP
jgi:hypothetical protein